MMGKKAFKFPLSVLPFRKRGVRGDLIGMQDSFPRKIPKSQHSKVRLIGE
jgi:hypothetical protein